MRAKRIDGNQNEVVKNLRKVPGVTVAITSMVGGGFPDIVVGYRGENLLIELKDPSQPKSARKLTKPEQKFHDTWMGSYYVCETATEILELLGVNVKYIELNDRQGV